jgi:fructose-1,6-bisphosphatase/inositol monophosphatase family enzyme
MKDFAELCHAVADRIHSAVSKNVRDSPLAIGTQVGMGADGTPTDLIDKIAEDEAMKAVKQSGLNMNVLSEEAGFVDKKAEYTLVLDPVDGTRNACRNLPFYCTSIAIGKVSLSDVEYGLVMNIPSGDVYEAKKGSGAYLNGKKIKVREYEKESSLFSFVSGGIKKEFTERLLDMPHLRALGACALEMSLVASGALDGYLMFNPVARITDIAAGALLVKEAGGVLYNAKGEELNLPFNVKDRTSVIALSCKEIKKEFL